MFDRHAFGCKRLFSLRLRGIRHIERRASTASMGDSEFDYSSDEYGGEGKATGRKVRGGFVLW
jgi:hypothetical protein